MKLKILHFTSGNKLHIDNILKKLKSKLSEFEYQFYISLMEYDENASRTDMKVFYVPNIFVANWIKSNHLESIIDAFEEESNNGVRPEIHIKVKEKKEALLFLGRLSYSENTIWKYCSLCLMTTRERLCRGMNQVYKAPLIGIILIF